MRSIRYRGLGYKIALMLFAVSFVVLGYLGIQQPTPVKTLIARICTIYYFGYFVFLWAYTAFGWEKTKPVPERVTK